MLRGDLEPPRRALSIRRPLSVPGPFIRELRSKIWQDAQLESPFHSPNEAPGTPATPFRKVAASPLASPCRGRPCLRIG